MSFIKDDLKCEYCGQLSHSDALECRRCGAPLPKLDQISGRIGISIPPPKSPTNPDESDECSRACGFSVRWIFDIARKHSISLRDVESCILHAYRNGVDVSEQGMGQLSYEYSKESGIKSIAYLLGRFGRNGIAMGKLLSSIPRHCLPPIVLG